MHHLPHRHAQVKREVTIGEAAALLIANVPEGIQRTALGIPKFVPTFGQLDAGRVITGCTAFVGVAAHALIEVDVPDPQRKAGNNNEE